jgi:hypothetical protein
MRVINRISDDSLSVKTKDSVEDLPSMVSRSPKSPAKSPRSPKKHRKSIEINVEPPPSPQKSPTRSPRRHRLRKKLTLNINGAEFDIEREKRPLSLFTGGGLLRKVGFPSTAPPHVTEFGPTVEDEVKADLNENKQVDAKQEKSAVRTTSVERGGKTLMGFLGRRIANGRRN